MDNEKMELLVRKPVVLKMTGWSNGTLLRVPALNCNSSPASRWSAYRCLACKLSAGIHQSTYCST